MFDTGKKRLLALDGGGILGVISLGALRKIESDLRTASGKNNLRLRDFFDYIGGTSTGAIIASGLALGMTVDEIEEIYLDEGELIFDRRSWTNRIASGLRSSYDHKKLSQRLKEKFTDGTIQELQAKGHLARDKHLLVVTRNINTDSPWPITTNPKAKYNDLARADCNLRIPLWQLVRASTAAPTFFAPERLQWDPSDPDKQSHFEDGGVTPYNNPSALLFRMATAPAYRCNWAVGEDKMMLVSVGTGYAYRALETPDPRGEWLGTTARTIPSELMRGIAVENDISCRMLGRCVAGQALDREIGDLIDDQPDIPKHFCYARFDIDTSQSSLDELGLSHIDSGLLTLDNAKAALHMKEIGTKLGDQVDMETQFGDFLK
ncbi:MAG: patatin-like phospholipase family protein [Pseudomonadota bacterium]